MSLARTGRHVWVMERPGATRVLCLLDGFRPTGYEVRRLRVKGRRMFAAVREGVTLAVCRRAADAQEFALNHLLGTPATGSG